MRVEKREIVKWWLATVLLLAGIIGMPVLRAQAQEMLEVSPFSGLMTATEKIDAKESPNKEAETILSFEIGDILYVTGETENGWYQISYQGQTAYVMKNVLKEQEMDVEAMDAELLAQEDEGRMIIEEVERYRAEVKRSRIWGTVIVLLIIGIFATGIISTVKGEKEKKDEEAETEGKENEDISPESEVIDLDEENDSF